MTTGAYRNANATVSAHGAVAVTPNDSTELPVPRSLYVGVSGDIKVTMVDGQDVVFENVPVGIFPIQALKVWSTGTTATGIRALY